MTVQVVGDAMARPTRSTRSNAATADVSLARGRRQRRRAPDPDGSSSASSTSSPGLIVIDGVGLVGDRHADEPHVDAGSGLDRHVQRRAPTPASSARTSTRAGPGHDGIGLARAARLRAARLQGRRRQDRQDLPGDRRRAVLGAGRPRASSAPNGGHRTARPRLGDHQLRRREDLRRGGRKRDAVAPGGRRRRGVRPARASAGARRSSRSCTRRRRRAPTPQELIEHAAAPSPATSCRRPWSSGPRSAQPAGKADYRWAREQAVAEN